MVFCFSVAHLDLGCHSVGLVFSNHPLGDGSDKADPMADVALVDSIRCGSNPVNGRHISVCHLLADRLKTLGHGRHGGRGLHPLPLVVWRHPFIRRVRQSTCPSSLLLGVPDLVVNLGAISQAVFIRREDDHIQP
jgi:hypothetical protein